MKFYPADWQADQALRSVGLEARGLWIECMCIMHRAEPYGHLVVNGRPVTDAQLAILAGTLPDRVPVLMAELATAGVFSRNRASVIYSRRMTRDEKRRALAEKNGSEGGNPALIRGQKLDRGAKPSLVEAVWAKGDGRCHYCDISLTRDGNRKTAFEIDHVIPRSKGGTNDLGNLVSACPACNNAKSDNLLDNHNKKVLVKPQKPEARIDSEADASGAEAPRDPVKDLWDRGILILGKGQRALIGKYRKTYGDTVVLAAIVQCEAEQPSDAVAYFVACCERRRGNGRYDRHAADAITHDIAVDILGQAGRNRDFGACDRGSPQAPDRPAWDAEELGDGGPAVH